MAVVVYSLLPDAGGAQERRWLRSARSVRRLNGSVELCLCAYGGLTAETVDAAGELGVRVLHFGDYDTALAELPSHQRVALRELPTLHKLTSLRAVARGHEGPILYLDCDTHCRGELGPIIDRCPSNAWFAREEPLSSRSAGGYDSAYVDEEALRDLAQREGLIPVPPYNVGVFLAGASVVIQLAALVEDFLWYTWRLLVGTCLWQPELLDPPLVSLVRGSTPESERRLAMPYPSGNGWIIEQIATWLTLGRIPGLRHDVLARSDFVQGDEHLYVRDYTIAHYYSRGEDAFVAGLTGDGLTDRRHS